MKSKSIQHTLRHVLPLCAALGLATPLWAQTPPATQTTEPQAARVGEATHSLLQRQREGRDASATPRPIDGRVVDVSHQRYLKSFETPLPEWFDSKLKK